MINISKELSDAMARTSGSIIEDMLAEDAMDAETIAAITPEHFYKFYSEEERRKFYAEIEWLNKMHGLTATEQELAKHVCTYY